MKKTYRMPPCSIYDVPAMESWLSDMTQTGLYLQKAGRHFFVFLKKEASDTRYRLEPAPDSCPAPADDVRELFAQAGWEFVTAICKSFFVWRSIQPDADELHSDPVVHSTVYGQLLRRLRIHTISAAILPLFLLAVFVCGLLLSPRPITLFLANPSMPLLILAEALLGIQTVRQALHLRSLKRSLANGQPALHQKDYRKGQILRRILRLAAALPSLLILAIAAGVLLLGWKKTISDVDTALPYLPLDQIENHADFSWHKDAAVRGGVDAYNQAEYVWSPLVPAHYEIYQQGEVQHIYQKEDTIAVAPSAYTEYFRLAHPAFTLPLYREQVSRYIHSDTSSAVTELSHPGFDLVTIAKAEGYTQLFACRGCQYIHIQYWGNADLAEKLDLLANTLQQL